MLLPLAIALLAPSADASATEVAGYDEIAMMHLSSLGSTDEAVEAIERILVAEAGKLVGARLIAPAELGTRGREGRASFDSCDGVVACLVEVVGALGWDAFVVGNIAGLGDGRVINLKLVDVRVGADVRRAAAKVSGSESELIREIRKAAVMLLAPDQLVGTIDIRADQQGVLIAIDGSPVGTTPLAKSKITVPVGRHAIEATGEGLVSFESLVDVDYGDDKRVDIHLPVNTLFVGGDTPFRSRWWTWAAAGAGAVAVGLGGYFNYLQADTSKRIETKARRGTLTVEDTHLFADEESYWNKAVIAYGAGGVLLTGVTVLWVTDLFD